MGRVLVSNDQPLCLPLHPALYSIAKSFCSHSPTSSSQEPDRKGGQEDLPTARTPAPQMPCRGLALALCYCSTFCRWGNGGPKWGYDLSQTTEPEGGPCGTTHPGSPPPGSTPARRHSAAQETNSRSHLQSHFFQAELFPGWVSPLGKAPRLF